MDIWTIVLGILVIIVGILLILVLLLSYLVRCAWDISITLPVGEWVGLDEVLKIGYNRRGTILVLEALRKVGMMSFRFVGTPEDLEAMGYEIHYVDDPEAGDEPEFNEDYAELYEYMLHRRPRRRRRVSDSPRVEDDSMVPATM